MVTGSLLRALLLRNAFVRADLCLGAVYPGTIPRYRHRRFGFPVQSRELRIVPKTLPRDLGRLVQLPVADLPAVFGRAAKRAGGPLRGNVRCRRTSANAPDGFRKLILDCVNSADAA